MRVYLDASALVKKYCPEIGSVFIKKIFSMKTIERVTSEWSLLEIVAAIDKKVLKRQITLDERDEALTIFLSDIQLFRITFVKFTSEFLRPTSTLIVKHHISAADGLHLFSAIASISPVLLAADKALIKAAKDEDIEAYNMEDKADIQKLEIILEKLPLDES